MQSILNSKKSKGNKLQNYKNLLKEMENHAV